MVFLLCRIGPNYPLYTADIWNLVLVSIKSSEHGRSFFFYKTLENHKEQNFVMNTLLLSKSIPT